MALLGLFGSKKPKKKAKKREDNVVDSVTFGRVQFGFWPARKLGRHRQYPLTLVSRYQNRKTEEIETRRSLIAEELLDVPGAVHKAAIWLLDNQDNDRDVERQLGMLANLLSPFAQGTDGWSAVEVIGQRHLERTKRIKASHRPKKRLVVKNRASIYSSRCSPLPIYSSTTAQIQFASSSQVQPLMGFQSLSGLEQEKTGLGLPPFTSNRFNSERTVERRSVPTESSCSRDPSGKVCYNPRTNLAPHFSTARRFSFQLRFTG